MKVAGELIRSTALDKFRKRAARPKTAGLSKKRSAKSAVSEDSGSEIEEVKPPALTPTDKLALALTAKLEADMETNKPKGSDAPAMKYRLSDFLDISQVLRQAGILQEDIVSTYVTTLEDNGFETPLLMLGLQGRGNLEFVQQGLGFRAGHTLRLTQFLQLIDADM